MIRALAPSGTAVAKERAETTMQPNLLSSAVLLLSLTFSSGEDGLTEPRGSPPAARPAEAAATGAKYDLARTRIEWGQGLESALGKGRPILLFQLLGNFDDAFC